MAGKEGAELQYLERYYEKAGSQLVILYGQKNIGMREMLHTFCQEKPCCFYAARPCSEREQLFLWGNELREDGASLPQYPEYSEVFQALTDDRSEKKVIVIDEFQNMVKQSREFMPQLIRFMKNEWSSQEVMILLCSTSTGWVENSMVSRIGTAVYEISGFVKMKEYSFYDMCRFFAGKTKKECIELYAVLGGFPGLWKHFEPELSVKENICRHILNRDSFLHEEALRLVAEELRETGVYHAILAALAAGREKLNELYRHTGFSRAKISVYLKNLMELEIVEKVFSYDTAGRENTQKGIYRIKNRFVLFYFRYLYPHLSRLAWMTPQDFYEAYIVPDFRAFSEDAFRQACTEALEYKNANEELPFVYTRFGEWVGKVGNIDVVAEDEAGHALVALCNWEKPQMSYEDYEWLLFCAGKAKLSPDCICLFSAGGFEESLEKEAERNESLQLMDINAI